MPAVRIGYKCNKCGNDFCKFFLIDDNKYIETMDRIKKELRTDSSKFCDNCHPELEVDAFVWNKK